MFSLHAMRRWSLSLTFRRTLNLRRFSATSLRNVSEEGKIKFTGGKYPTEYGKPSFVHSSAIVHPNANLGQGVSVGPFCTVGPLAKLGNSCQMYPGSHIFGNTHLGGNCILMTASCCDWNEMPRHEIQGSECFLEIGDNNEIREYTSIHRSSKPSDKTVIGNNNLIMGSCHIAHDCKVGNNNILANSTLMAGHVVVEDYSHTAGATVIHQFCRIGSFSFIGGGSVVSQDVPRYLMVSGERAELRGLNLEGLRRRGFSVTEIRSLRSAYRKIFMASDANSTGIDDRLTKVERDEELALVPAVRSMLQSIRESFTEDRRGICKFRCWSGT